MSIRGRLVRLEQHARAVAPDPHSACLQLWQARIASVEPWGTWDDDFVPPDKRPDDGAFYPKFECFHGDAESCPHRAWADKCWRRDVHFHAMRDLDPDAYEDGPPLSPEAEAQRGERLAAFRARMTKDLPKLEARLARLKEERGGEPRRLEDVFSPDALSQVDDAIGRS